MGGGPGLRSIFNSFGDVMVGETARCTPSHVGLDIERRTGPRQADAECPRLHVKV